MKICQVAKKSAVVETASCKEVGYFARTALYQKNRFLEIPQIISFRKPKNDSSYVRYVRSYVRCLFTKNTHALGKEKSLIWINSNSPSVNCTKCEIVTWTQQIETSVDENEKRVKQCLFVFKSYSRFCLTNGIRQKSSSVKIIFTIWSTFIIHIYIWLLLQVYQGLNTFFYLGLLSRTFTIHSAAGEGTDYLFNASLPLPPASQTLRHYPGDYCRELTSAHS